MGGQKGTPPLLSHSTKGLKRTPLLHRADARAEHARFVLGVQLENRARAVRAGEQKDHRARHVLGTVGLRT